MELPDFLITQIREGKAVLVFGAGASMGAVDADGSRPPSGAQLSAQLSQRFLGGRFDSAPLSQVSEYAISESSLVEVQEFIRGIFEGFEPAGFHRRIPQFRWHGLATTNYDRIIEKAYEQDASPLQRVQPVISNGDRVQEYLRNPDNVILLKLHGCISQTANEACPLILTTDQYVEYQSGRSRLFAMLQEWAYERPLVFVGQSIQDPDLRALLLSIASLSEKRARCYAVMPDASEIALRFWETKKITVLSATCEEFLQTLHIAIPTNARALAGFLTREEAHPIAERFRATDVVLSDSCRFFLQNDVDYVRNVTSEQIDPRHFYRGMTGAWSAVEQNLDAPRKLADTILSDIVLADEIDRPKGVELVLVKGHAGAGKSVLLRRLAWDASREYNAVTLFVKAQGAIATAAIREILNVIDDRLYLFVDDAADRVRELGGLIRDIGGEGKRLTVFLAERINEWNIGGAAIDPHVSTQYSIPYLEPDEIKSLLELLAKYRALGTLEHSTPAERVIAFEQRAGRQLLVALHEATLGRPFEDIIDDEYRNIFPAEAQQIYLTICVLNRLNVPVRAGLIARIHGIPFEYFQQRFFKPLEHVVQTAYDSRLRDHTYESRHPEIAEIVFRRELETPEDRLDKYLRCLMALNIDFNTDERAFRQMLRGRVVQELFPSSEMARHVYKVARESVGDEPFLLQQIAVYEMNSPNGSLSKAGELLEQAARGAQNDVSIKHSRAELLLRLADIARTPLEREQRLREAAKIASSLRDERHGRGDSSHAFHTLSKVGLRRLEDLLTAGSTESDEVVGATIKNLEDNLQDGLQRFPDDSYLLTAEARLATLLRDSVRATSAMRAAFKVNPRNSAIAVRLAKVLEASGDAESAEATLKTALDANPGEKRLHYAFAQFLMRHERQQPEQIEYHLQRAFTDGDNNYDAQLLYARQLYIRGDMAAARDRFTKLAVAKVGPEVRDQLRYALEGSFSGRITRREATYCFVARDGIGDWVFAHQSEVAPNTWAKVFIGVRVRFKIAFTMKGAAAQEVSLETAEPWNVKV